MKSFSRCLLSVDVDVLFRSNAFHQFWVMGLVEILLRHNFLSVQVQNEFKSCFRELFLSCL